MQGETSSHFIPLYPTSFHFINVVLGFCNWNFSDHFYHTSIQKQMKTAKPLFFFLILRKKFSIRNKIACYSTYQVDKLWKRAKVIIYQSHQIVPASYRFIHFVATYHVYPPRLTEAHSIACPLHHILSNPYHIATYIVR